MHNSSRTIRISSLSVYSFISLLFCLLLAACNVNISTPTTTGNPPSNSGNAPPTTCQSNCSTGSGVQGVKIYVEPDAGESPITSAISNAQKSVWVEMYLLSDRNVISALEEAAQRGIDVRVMLEPHPVGGGNPTRTLDQLQAASAKVNTTNPSFTLTHEKGMIIDSTTAYIMTSNFTRSALGGSSGGSYGYTNREYGIIDTNPQDVQAVSDIFQADWNRSTPQINDANLVVSPVNSRSDFTTLINSAKKTVLIEAEEMADDAIEQAIINAEHRGVQVQVILPVLQSSSGSVQGVTTLQQGNVAVREDPHLYMHAKIIVVDGQIAFVGSENISTASLDQNRELGILVSDGGVINTLQQTFQQDWNDSQNP